MTFFKSDSILESLGNQVLEKTLAKFATLNAEQCAITWIVYRQTKIIEDKKSIFPQEFSKHLIHGFNHRGTESMYPASIVKLFYLVAIHQWLEVGKVSLSSELSRAVNDMVVQSSNDATSLVMDSLTDTNSGPELVNNNFSAWKYKRNIINIYFKTLGWQEFKPININQKTWSDGPYGREKKFLGEMKKSRNVLTTNAVARLFHNIVSGTAVSLERSMQMMSLLKRAVDDIHYNSSTENQVTGFLGEGLPKNAELWSKAGWTSQVRHDAAYIKVPGLPPFLFIMFIEGEENSKNKKIFPFVSELIVEKLYLNKEYFYYWDNEN